jgi:hypothetical protein
MESLRPVSAKFEMTATGESTFKPTPVLRVKRLLEEQSSPLDDVVVLQQKILVYCMEA